METQTHSESDTSRPSVKVLLSHLIIVLEGIMVPLYVYLYDERVDGYKDVLLCMVQNQKSLSLIRFW